MSDHELTQLNSKENNLLGMFAQVTGVKSNSQEPLDSPKVALFDREHCGGTHETNRATLCSREIQTKTIAWSNTTTWTLTHDTTGTTHHYKFQ